MLRLLTAARLPILVIVVVVAVGVLLMMPAASASTIRSLTAVVLQIKINLVEAHAQENFSKPLLRRRDVKRARRPGKRRTPARTAKSVRDMQYCGTVSVASFVDVEIGH